jgi:hypothetical protein
VLQQLCLDCKTVMALPAGCCIAGVMLVRSLLSWHGSSLQLIHTLCCVVAAQSALPESTSVSDRDCSRVKNWFIE